jgi:hypothetical protein
MKRQHAAAASLAALLLLGSPRAKAQEMTSCPAHKSHADPSDAAAAHHAGVDSRGDAVMGFDHETTTHHFLLAPDGGSIEVTANDPEDAASRDAIRGHLSHIAGMFAAGNFEAPMLVHDRVPPGVPELQRRKTSIRWRYEDLPSGGRVVAASRDKKAVAAVHEFLKFQIADHRTGDPGTVSR